MGKGGISMNSSSISTAISGNKCMIIFDADVFTPKQSLLKEIRDEITERCLKIDLDVTSFDCGILTLGIKAVSAVGYAVVELLNHIIERIKASTRH